MDGMAIFNRRCMAFAVAVILLAVGISAAAGEATGDQGGISNEIRASAGFVDFGSIQCLRGQEPQVEAMLPKVLLDMMLSTAREAHPELASIVDGLDVRLVQFRLYGALGEAYDQAGAEIGVLRDGLLNEGWVSVLKVPEQNAVIMLRSDGDQLQGLAAMFASEGQLGMLNVVGDVNSSELGGRVGRVVNKALNGQLDLEQLMQNLAISFGAAQPEMEPDGYTVTLEVEDMRIETGASIADDPALGDIKAVRMDTVDGRITGRVALEPGTYQVRLFMVKPDNEHDAVLLGLDGQPPQRVHSENSGYGPVWEVLNLNLTDTREVPIEILGAEMGMYLDKVEFVRVREKSAVDM